MGKQAGPCVGDGHQGLGWSHRRQLIGLAGLLPGTLLEDFNHGILLNDLSVESLDPKEG